MSGGADFDYDDPAEIEIKKTIDEIDEMVNKGVVDSYEAARLKDQIMSGRKNCLA